MDLTLQGGKLRNTRTKLFSAGISSMLICRSGKPEKSVVKDSLKDSGVFPAPLVKCSVR